MYIPHEIAHQWFSSALPTWMAEGSAVYANYLYLAQRADARDSIRLLKDLNDAFQTNKDYPFTLLDSRGITAYVKGSYLMTMLTSVNKQGTISALRDFIQEQFKRCAKIRQEMLITIRKQRGVFGDLPIVLQLQPVKKECAELASRTQVRGHTGDLVSDLHRGL